MVTVDTLAQQFTNPQYDDDNIQDYLDITGLAT